MIFSVTNMVKLYPYPLIGRIAKKINFILGVDIPRCVKIGKNVTFPHNAIGTVIHDNTVIEDDVTIYQNVTFGRSDVYKRNVGSMEFGGFEIKKGACICAGAKIICKKGRLVVGENSVIGANSLLLNSTGPNEIWGGCPARFLGYRDDLQIGDET